MDKINLILSNSLLGIVVEIKKILHITKINLWRFLQQERERMSIFIPLKIAKWKRYKNAVDGVVHEAIQIVAESDLSTEQRCLCIQHTCSPMTSPVP